MSIMIKVGSIRRILIMILELLSACGWRVCAVVESIGGWLLLGLVVELGLLLLILMYLGTDQNCFLLLLSWVKIAFSTCGLWLGLHLLLWLLKQSYSILLLLLNLILLLPITATASLLLPIEPHLLSSTSLVDMLMLVV